MVVEAASTAKNIVVRHPSSDAHVIITHEFHVLFYPQKPLTARYRRTYHRARVQLLSAAGGTRPSVPNYYCYYYLLLYVFNRFLRVVLKRQKRVWRRPKTIIFILNPSRDITCGGRKYLKRRKNENHNLDPFDRETPLPP